MSMYSGFDDSWYANMIFQLNLEDEKAIAIIYGFAMLSESVNRSLGCGSQEERRDSLAESIHRLADTAEHLAAILSKNKRQD
jgi:hypothetical protein